MALDKLIHIIANDPLLAQPDPDKPFEIEINASSSFDGPSLIEGLGCSGFYPYPNPDNPYPKTLGKPKPLSFLNCTSLDSVSNM
jgi:hypothetical protein